MRSLPTLSQRHQALVAKANHTALSTDEQDELAQAFGRSRQDLPLSMRGGLMGVFGFDKNG